MKPNDPHHWMITLAGKTRRGKPCRRHTAYVGTLDSALAAADEFESSVSFEVLKFTVTRGKKVK